MLHRLILLTDRRIIPGSKFCSVKSAPVSISSRVKLLTIDRSILELPGVHLVLKQQINLPEAAILGLRQPEPTPDIARQIRAGVEESGLGAPVPTYCRSRQ